MARLDLAPLVRDFCQQSVERHQALARAGHKIADAASSGPLYAHMLDSVDFTILREFLDYAQFDFAVAGLMSGDDKPDQQNSPDGYGIMDRSKT